MEESLEIKYEVDTCGYCCPIPMVTTMKMLARIHIGECLRIKATDASFANDLKSIEQMGKFVILDSQETDEHGVFIIKKS